MKHEEFCSLFNVYETTVRNLLQFPSRHTQEQKDGARVAIIRAWQAACTPAADSSDGASGDALKLCDSIIRDMEDGFVRCSNCGEQEDTKTLDFMRPLVDLRVLITAPVAVDSSARDAVISVDETRLRFCMQVRQFPKYVTTPAGSESATPSGWCMPFFGSSKMYSTPGAAIDAAMNAVRNRLPPA